jgi:16S rRNA (guanine966-N2)-methyltransferase
MRVISGAAKGTVLVAPRGLDIRPTLDRVREALFSILGPGMEGACFLDLFAGTGANGVEALSRGAAAAVFVDKDARSLAAIRQNLHAAHFEDRGRIVRAVLPAGFNAIPADCAVFDFVFADPPYVFDDFEGLLGKIAERPLLATTGQIIAEHASRTVLPEKIGPYSQFRRAVYGDTALSFFS